MEGVREYLLSVSAAAILCSCVGAFFSKKGTVQTLVKTLCGIFVCLTVLSPVIRLSLPDLENYFSSFSLDGQAITDDAIRSAADAKCQVIMQQAEAYVYDKAAILGCDITVSIALETQEPYAPETIVITGNLSPYARSQLSDSIASDLGIPEEDQQWIS